MNTSLGKLKPHKGTRWRTTIDNATIFDCPLSLEIETRSTPAETPVPELSNDERKLAEFIITNVKHCIAECMRLFDNDPSYQHLSDSDSAKIENPHIWISREVMNEDGIHRWAMVVGIDVNPDFGWHVEFDGLNALELWAGD